MGQSGLVAVQVKCAAELLLLNPAHVVAEEPSNGDIDDGDRNH